MHASSQSSRQRNCVRLREVLSARGFLAVASIFPLLGSARVSLSRASPSRSGLGRVTSLRLWSSFCLFPTNRRASQFTTNDDRQVSSVNFLVPLEIGLFLSYLRLVSRVLGQDWDTTRDPPCDLLPLGEKERGARNLNKGATFYEDRPSQRRKQGCK